MSLCEQVANFPHMVCDASLHRGRDANTGMDSAEIIEREVKRKCCPVVLPLLAEAIRQTGESANRHPHGEVLALDMGRADSCGIGLPDNWDYLRAHHFSGRIAALAFRCCPIHFDKPCEVNAVMQRVADRADVGNEAISGDLKILA